VVGDVDVDYAIVGDCMSVFETVCELARSKYAGEEVARLVFRFGKGKCWMKMANVSLLLGVCPETY
jgi:hypothetical protein